MTFEQRFTDLLTHHGEWAYLILIVGTFLEGETILVVGGYLAHEGYLSLPWVLASAFTGSFAGDQLYFFIGRLRGKPFLEQRPKLQSSVARVHRMLERWHTGFILAFRFLYGLRTVSPFVLGTTKVPTLRFFCLNLTGALLWAVGIGYAGYLFGDVVKHVLGEAQRYEKFALGALVVVGVTVSALLHLRARRTRTESDRRA